jgi:hypothetical protein
VLFDCRGVEVLDPRVPLFYGGDDIDSGLRRCIPRNNLWEDFYNHRGDDYVAGGAELVIGVDESILLPEQLCEDHLPAQ